jgi:hypothetical protein
MKRHPVPVLVTALTLLAFTSGLAQFTEEELGRRPFWEKFLEGAKFTKAEKIGEGVTHPRKIWLKKGDVEAIAVWKRPSETGAGRFDRWEHEIAAYRLDKLLGLGLVPPTVQRSYHGYPGSLQLWVDLAFNELGLQRDKVEVPADKREAYDRVRSLQKAWDSLIANADRTLQNLRYTQDWRLILIDHSQAFRDMYPYTGRLLFDRGNDPSHQGFSRLPRWFVAKLKALDHAKVRNAVEDYLTSSAIDALLERRDLILKEVEALIKDKGENLVLY